MASVASFIAQATVQRPPPSQADANAAAAMLRRMMVMSLSPAVAASCADLLCRPCRVQPFTSTSMGIAILGCPNLRRGPDNSKCRLNDTRQKISNFLALLCRPGRICLQLRLRR